MRYRVQKDGNHKAMTAFLRSIHWWHQDVSHHLGLGFDILTRHKDGFPMFIEIKDPSKPPSRRALQPSEEAMRAAFPHFFAVCLHEVDLARAIGLTLERVDHP